MASIRSLWFGHSSPVLIIKATSSNLPLNIARNENCAQKGLLLQPALETQWLE